MMVHWSLAKERRKSVARTWTAFFQKSFPAVANGIMAG